MAAVVPALIVSVDEPDPPDASEILVGLRAVFAPLERLGDVVAERVTVPANPPLLLTLIVEAPETLACKVNDAGLAYRAKSEPTVCTFSLVLGS